MAILNIITYPHSMLSRTCEPVTVFDEKLKKLVQDMAETMYGADGVGLAAPQVGVPKRIIVVDAAETLEQRGKKYLFLVNPELIDAHGQVEFEEGCLSIPNVSLLLTRSSRVVVRGQTPDGEPIDVSATGLLAIVLQHEIDHLDGILIWDHLSPVQRKLYIRQYLKQRKEKGDTEL